MKDARLPPMTDTRAAARRPAPLLDRVGATGSLVCAVHCALLPLLIALLPSLGIAAWLGENFERGFVLFATLLGLFTLLWGYRRHRAGRALGLLLPGLAALWLGVLYEALHEAVVPHAVVMTFGGTLVGLAHLANLRLSHGHVHGAHCATERPARKHPAVPGRVSIQKGESFAELPRCPVRDSRCAARMPRAPAALPVRSPDTTRFSP